MATDSGSLRAPRPGKTLEQALKKFLRPRGSVFPRCNSECHQEWSEGSEKQQQPATATSAGAVGVVPWEMTAAVMKQVQVTAYVRRKNLRREPTDAATATGGILRSSACMASHQPDS